MSANQKKWQKEFFDKVFAQKTKNNDFSDIILDELSLLNNKNKYLPNSLFKFYTTTSENILDIKNKRLWLSHPSSFNDPYDCSIGYNEVEYEKNQLIEAITKDNLVGTSGNNVITEDELMEIKDSCVNGEEYYLYPKKEGFHTVIRKIAEKKTESLRDKIYKHSRDANDDANQKIDNIRETNIRVACFSAKKPHGAYYFSSKNHECLSQIHMLSHYANNHKGFCVEYDISSLKKDTTLNFSRMDFYSDNKENYLEERLSVITKGGLFPVIYNAQRVNIPYTKLKKYKLDERNDIIKTLYKAYITKSSVWSYENEWRLIVDENISGYYKNKIPFPYVKKIYIGCKMEKNYIDELISIAKELGVDIHLMEMEGRKFDLFETSTFSYKWDEELRLYKVPYKK